MKVGKQVRLGPGHIVLDGALNFRPVGLSVVVIWTDQDAMQLVWSRTYFSWKHVWAINKNVQLKSTVYGDFGSDNSVTTHDSVLVYIINIWQILKMQKLACGQG